MKKFLAILLSVMLVLAFSTVAFAATITVTTPTDSGNDDYSTENYKAYKIFDAVIGGTITTNDQDQTISGGGVTYTIDSTSPWFSVLFNVDGTTGAVTPKSGQTWVTVTPTNTSGVYKVSPTGTFTDNASAQSFAEWLDQNKTASCTGTTLNEGANTLADDGYYLITSSLGKTLGLATTDIPMTIVEKNDYPTVAKAVTDDDVQFGQNTQFTLTVEVPSTATQDIYLTDTMGTGLTFVSIDSCVNNDSTPATVNYTTHLTKTGAETTLTAANVTGNTPANTFVIKIPAAQVQANRGKTITVTYTAKLNSNAIVSVNDETDMTDGNINTVVLNYSNFETSDSVDVHSTGITLLKYDGSTASNETNDVVLAGATFQLHKGGTAVQLISDGTTTVSGKTYDTYHVYDGTEAGTPITNIETDTNVIWVKGLDADETYTWYEVQAPTGYNSIEGEISLDNDAAIDDLYSRTNIVNNTGSILPSTGGIGTIIFYVVGTILVLGAGILLVAKRRSAVAEQ